MQVEDDLFKDNRLGKGLDALIPVLSDDVDSRREAVQRISIDKIKVNPLQPRKTFDDEALIELSNSIKQHGILQPLVVTASGDGEFELIAGERRLRAAKKSGLHKVPVIVREADAVEKLELAIIENVQRDNLNAIEEGFAYKMLMEEFSFSQDEVAKKVGKSRSAISNKIRLLTLPVDVQKAVRSGEISEGHARALLGLDDTEAILTLLALIKAKKLNVREVEKRVTDLLGNKAISSPKNNLKDSNIVLLEDQLREKIGSRVQIKPAKRGGTITFRYNNKDEFENILSKLL